MVDRIFAPSVRWVFKRKANRAIDRLNDRLHLRIQPFKTTKKQALIDQLLLDPEVIKAIEEHVDEAKVPREVAVQKAERYAREIVPAFNAYAYTSVGTRISKWICTFVYRVRLGYADTAGLSRIDPDSSVVFVMNHRSNVDYLLVTYLASASATLSYAVGEWARVWALQRIVRWMGAYFIRRDSGNQLYRRVLARYVHMATRSGVTQAVFPEGGLSRDGTLGKPKLGLLSYMIGGHNEREGRDVVFVPVGINYDRVVEDRMLTASKDKIGKGVFRVNTGTVLSFVWNLMKLRFQGRLYRYGYACASFGKPISLNDWLKAKKVSIADASEVQRFAIIKKFGDELMKDVGKVVPVLPVSMVASVMRDAGNERLTELQLKARCAALIDRLTVEGTVIHMPRSDSDYAISAGLRMLTLRHIVKEDSDGSFTAEKSERMLLDYYANAIEHIVD